MSKPRPAWFWMLLSIGGVFVLMAIALVGILVWAFLNVREFKQQPYALYTTNDLYQLLKFAVKISAERKIV